MKSAGAMRLRTILIGVAILVASFLGATLALQFLSPGAGSRRPVLAEVPPLKAATRTSVIVTPTAIALGAIRDALEASAPRNLSGKRENPLTQLLSNADIGWTMGRGPLAVTGRPEAMAVSTVVNGTLHVTGQIASQVGNIGGALGGILNNQNLAQGLQNLSGKTLDQRADIRGNVTILARPAILPSWRLEPNLTAQVSVGDSALTIAGIKLGVSNEVKPFLERQVNEQVAALQTRLRGDPFLEQVARREWMKICRSISLGTAGAGLPELWLEIHPTRAFAGQPRIDAAAVTLVVGVQAETRVLPAQTKPDCPFPANLEIVPQADQGRVDIAVPIDVPFTEVTRVLAARLNGKTFPQDGSGPYEATVRDASIAASGDRLLISLRVRAREKTSWFGLGAEANVYVWGRPVLDRERQILRLADVAFDVDSEAAFGLLGAAARAAIPYLKDALAENTVLDLKPFAANARRGIEAALADFRSRAEGVRVEADITDLRLLDIEFDAQTLRVIAEVNGRANVAVTSLPAQ
jgi:hypothetical protein